MKPGLLLALSLFTLIRPGHGAVRSFAPFLAGSAFQAIGDRFNLPGRIQFEDYKPGGPGVGYNDLSNGNSGGRYRSDNVDIENTSDAGGGYDIGWTQGGEWLAYDINVTAAGTYSFSARLASGAGGTKAVTFSVDGSNVGTLNFTDASGWQSWRTATLSNINLTAGNHVLRVTMNTGNLNLNFVDFARQLSSNNNLAGLKLTDGILSPAFSSGTTSYQAYVASEVGLTSITPTASEPAKATVTINGSSVPAGQVYQFSLATGANLATITVRAENGGTRTYALTVTRAPMWPQVSGGGLHSLFLNQYGELFTSGQGTDGQLGNPTMENRKAPSFIDMGAIRANEAVTSIEAGNYHSLVDIGNYYVYGFGRNHYSQLLSGARNIATPALVRSGSSRISAGGDHSLFADPANALLGVGSNWHGQLAQPTLGVYGNPVVIAGNPKMVSAGYRHTLFISGSGTAYSFGQNNQGQLGDGTTTSSSNPRTVMSDVWKVSAGDYYSMFLKTDGSLWATGANNFGQLGDGASVDRLSPVYITNQVSAIATGMTHTLILKSDGTMWAVGRNNEGQLGDGTFVNRLTPVQVMSGVSSMSAGFNTSFAIKRDGTTWGAGRNYEGQLADGTTTSRGSFVQIGSGVLAVSGNSLGIQILKADGKLWTIGGTTPQLTMSPPGLVLSGGVTSVSRGFTHTMAVKADGTLWAMGANDFGQFGNGTTTPSGSYVQVFTNVAAVAVGNEMTMVLRKDGTLWGAGKNTRGQLGDGTVLGRTSFVQVASGVKKVTTGAEHTLFLKTNGTLLAMGANAMGELGDGTTTTRMSPIQISTNVSDIDCGVSFSLFSKSDNTVWGMGWNASGQLGTGDGNNRLSPVQIGLTGVVRVSAGGYHSMFLRSDGTAWATGYNEYYQVGNNQASTVFSPVQVLSNVKDISAGWNESYWIMNNSDLYACGLNDGFVLGVPWVYPLPSNPNRSAVFKPTRVPLL